MMPLLALALVAALSYLLRSCFVSLVPASNLPARVRAALDDVAPAVMAALVVTHLAHGQGITAVRLTDVGAACAAAAVAWRTENLALTAVAGVGTAALLRLL